jgi:hypothetical protein
MPQHIKIVISRLSDVGRDGGGLATFFIAFTTFIVHSLALDRKENVLKT